MDDLDRERPLFSDALYVQVKHPDHEKTLALTARVLRGSRPTQAGLGGGQREEVLHVELTDELDPFFLYTLQVGEDDYHQLKHDQRLRVDFKAFPQQFIDLLQSCAAAPAPDAASAAAAAANAASGGAFLAQERCCACQGGGCDRAGSSSQQPSFMESGPASAAAAAATAAAAPAAGAAPAFLARLETQPACGGGPLFSLVETNPFKELTHLSLRFRVGGDAAIKRYLAARLRQLKAESAGLSRELAAAEQFLGDERRNNAFLTEETARLKADKDREVRDVRAALGSEATAAAAAAAERAEAAAAAHAAAQRRAEEGARAEREALQARLADCEARRAEAADARAALEVEVRSLRQRSAAAEEAAAAAAEEVRSLREANRRHESEAFRLEKEGQALQLRVAALTQQVTDKEESASKSAALLSATEASRARAEESLAAYKANAVALQERLESSVTEIDRGNSIIARIQAEHKALRNKAKLKNEVIRQQERVIQEHREAAASYEARLRTAEAEGRAGRTAAAAAEAKLAESTRLLSSNQQVIAWLNKELNDAQLGGGGGGNGSGGGAGGFGVGGSDYGAAGAGLGGGGGSGLGGGGSSAFVTQGAEAAAGGQGGELAAVGRYGAPAFEGDSRGGRDGGGGGSGGGGGYDAGLVYRSYEPPNLVSPQRDDLATAAAHADGGGDRGRKGEEITGASAGPGVKAGGGSGLAGSRNGGGGRGGGRILDALSRELNIVPELDSAIPPGDMYQQGDASAFGQAGGLGGFGAGGVGAGEAFDDFDYGNLDDYGVVAAPADAYGIAAF